MKDKKDILQDYVADMLGVEKHIGQAIDRQVEQDSVRRHGEAHALLMRIAGTLKTHLSTLEGAMDTLGEDAKTALKRATTAVSGAVTGLYDKVRSSDQVSRNLRDDYTALNLAAVSYSMLHTTALALGERRLASLALDHLKDLTPLIMELSMLIPPVVAQELSEEGKAINPMVGREAAENTTRAWSPHKSRL